MLGAHCPEQYPFLPLAAAVAFCLPALAEETSPSLLEFDPAFISMSNAVRLDLSRFSRGGAALPGIYRTRVYLNDQIQTTEDISFVELADKRVEACLTPRLLAQLPLNLPDAARQANTPCVDIQTFIPAARVAFDSSEQSLNISVPQIYITRMARGTVPAAAWDSGIPAALLSYNVSAWNSNSYGHDYRSLYSGINGGLNLGGWYLRHNGSWNWNNATGSRYQNINTYLQRDIPQIKGRVIGGSTSTTGRLFDTLPFTGIKLESDDRMEPASRRGYAPEIRGIARTSAKVTVHQNGMLLYETTVSPGEFVIDDLYPTGYGGDLDVTVYEADGSEQHFQVPFSSVTQLLRPGASRYELVAGELNASGVPTDPLLLQATWQYGLNNHLTVYGGAQGSEHYLAGQAGGAVATPLGAFSLDITHARTELTGLAQDNDVWSGESYRLSYSKNITETRSNFSLAAYRFSTSHYLDFLTAMQTRYTLARGYDDDAIRRVKNRFTLTATQGLPDRWGQLYISASSQNYWNADGTDKQYQIGYNNTWRGMTYGVSGARTRSETGTKQDTVMLTLSLPLGSARNAPTGRLSYTTDNDGRHAWQAGISGTAGEENALTYGVTGAIANQGTGSSGSASAQYRSPYTTLSASASTGRHYHSTSAGLNGTVIGHSGGITLSPWQGDTFALVEAKGAEGARVGGHSGVYINRSGYAAVPYLSPYQMNDIAIDLRGTAAGVELENTSQKVAPRDRAVVKLSYSARSGRPLLITADWQGEPVPFGAEARDEQGNIVGYVGQGGQIYARVEKDSGALNIAWGTDGEQRCQVNYRMAPGEPQNNSTALQMFTAACN
ncbi:fimbria/pilus outer membrane usher protein [Entomohabitans teleogrylli]|uniref:fimbria/pilus outer membrane usher protein n=1 Tax=Entomohabitans teleogrylli TaxID=1384589 RepID=UPI00073D78C7|nr:fimbria/pilus outer membrane usher protein [Entomohabitans teleogrylli]